MKGSGQTCPNSSTSAPRLPPSASILNTALPPLPWSGFDHDGAMTRLEILHRVEAAGDHRWRHELGEVEHEHFFGRVAHRDRVVDDERLVPDSFEQPGTGEIAEVEGRILPHQHDIDIAAEVEQHRIAEPVMRARFALRFEDAVRLRRQPPGLPRQPAHVVADRVRSRVRAPSGSGGNCCRPRC